VRQETDCGIGLSLVGLEDQREVVEGRHDCLDWGRLCKLAGSDVSHIQPERRRTQQ
jgi:hypothetical protein